jgi:diaminopimelate dehydrogenase
MDVLRLAVIGFGQLGRACIQAINEDEQSQLAGVVRRHDVITQKLPKGFETIPVAGHISELGHVDAALICVPVEAVVGIAHDLLQAGIPVVECANLHGEAFQAHKSELDRYANHFRVPAIVGAGWDPGMLSVFRDLFALLIPKGHTDITHRPGINLHHTTLAQAVPGVKNALATECTAVDGQRQHYVYVELQAGAGLATVEQAIRTDPLFLDAQTFVFPVDSVTMLEQEGHGVLLQRRGTAGAVEHQLLLLEGRFSEQRLAAQVMLVAARALSSKGHHAYSLFDIPLGSLWGKLRELAEAASL